ncbi:MAG: hypothetical protein J2P38_06875 [Candidatus Dormibacteraeota bacterium]|nr:hypothetical protein [Candidatus Dormibacteraeota bacterium]
MGEIWDPFGTLHNALWIGGGQWAGKSTVANLLARRYGITAYHYDYHDARGHDDRRIARRAERGEPLPGPDPDQVWVVPTPEEMAADTLRGFPERFGWVLDDLRALVSGRPILAEGWGLRPELVAPLLDAPERMIVLVPTPEFHRHQTQVLERAGRLDARVSDPERAQRNRLARDRLVAADAVAQARRLGIRVLAVDGTRPVEAIAGDVAAHFHLYLRDPSGSGPEISVPPRQRGSGLS